MAGERMWTYPELRFVYANQFKVGAAELVAEVNERFHGGAQVRSAQDVQKVQKGKTIFNKEKKRCRA
jgi:hypothetical protein